MPGFRESPFFEKCVSSYCPATAHWMRSSHLTKAGPIGPPVVGWRLPVKSLQVAGNWELHKAESYGTPKCWEKPRVGRKQRERRSRGGKWRENCVSPGPNDCDTGRRCLSQALGGIAELL